MKIIFETPKNVIDLFIINYNIVPDIFRTHIPHPNRGWVSLKFKATKVEYIINIYGEDINKKPKSRVIDTITFDQAEFFKKEVLKWNKIANNLERKDLYHTSIIEKRYRKWLSKVSKEASNNYYVDIKQELILDSNKNIIRHLTYNDIGFKLKDLI